MPVALSRLLRDCLRFLPLSCFAALPLLPVSSEGAQPYFNGVFPTRVPGSATGWKSVNAFPSLSFTDPLWITELPGAGHMLVLEKGGKIWRFPNKLSATPAQRTLVLDISDRIQNANELGLLRMVFHPNFGVEGAVHSDELFLCYSHRPAGTVASVQKNMWRISRFQWDGDSGTINPESEEVLIQQYDPNGWHNGGAMVFDNEGYLMVTCGDGGAGNDSLRLAQKLDLGFFSGVLRIDVDNDPSRSHPIRRQPLSPTGKPTDYPESFSQGYGIPNDNPWQDPAGGKLEEFYALGLRSPHSGHYDSATGDFWVADVGQTASEELNLIKKGANYGWSFAEGMIGGPVGRPSPVIGTVTLPAYSYSPGYYNGSSIIGGLCYRGAKWSKELGGKIIIGDNTNGSLSSVVPHPSSQLTTVTKLLSNVAGSLYSGLANLGTDSSGEIYMVILNGSGQGGGKILKLDKTGSITEPPQLLSQTGLFTDLVAMKPAPDLIPYRVASPLWSDGAEKKRWIVKSESLLMKERGNWTFPNGTVTVKHFEMPVDKRDPSIVRKLETRVMVRTSDGGKYGVTYKWNAAGTDAQLLATGVEEDFPVTLQDGSTGSQRWSYPSRADCISCHTAETGQALGIRTHQLNLTVAHPQTGAPVNQLHLLREQGILQTQGQQEGWLRGAALDDESLPLEHRIRSYLDANCAHCHRPDSGVGFFDARLETPLRLQNLIDAPLTGHFEMPADARYIKPGNSVLSAIHVRGASAEPGIAMPAIGKHAVDGEAMDLLKEYIDGLTTEEFVGQPTVTGRYFRLRAPQSSRIQVRDLTILDERGFPLPVSTLSVNQVSSGSEAANAIDGVSSTVWRTASGAEGPHFITLDLARVRGIGGYHYLPGGSEWIRDFLIEVSDNGTDWTLVDSGSFPASQDLVKRDGIFLKPRPLRVNLLGPGQSRGKFQATLILDGEVNDLSPGDFIVEGGSVSSILGSGYFYSVEVTADQLDGESAITLTLPENVVNIAGRGNRAASITVANHDSVPPTAVFGPLAWSPEGRYTVSLTFSEEVTGLDASDFVFHNARLFSLTGSGANYEATLLADREGTIHASFPAGVFHDLNGIPNEQHFAQELNAPSWFDMSPQLELGQESRGFEYGWDLSGLGARQGVRGGDVSASPDYRTVVHVNLPLDGLYIFQALTHAPDTDSDSFYIAVDGGTPLLWEVNQGPGQIGGFEYHPGIAGDSAGEYKFQLSAGTHTIEIYAREDGALIREPEMIPVQPLPQWTVIEYDVFRRTAPFTSTLTFTRPVTGLEISDFVITGATVTSLQGSGRSYEITFMPTAREILINLPANSAHHGGYGSLASREWRYLYLSAYENWVEQERLVSGPAGYLADGDGDGLPQLIEYAFGLNPRVAAVLDPGGKGLPKLRLAGESANPKLALQFHRRTTLPGILYIPQFSSDGSIWEDATNPPVILESQIYWEKVEVSDHGAGARRFGRVKVDTIFK